MKWLVLIGLLVGGCAVERELPTCTDCPLEGVHPAGYADPKTTGLFHGKDLESRGWDFATCQRCHGDDFAGRSTAPSCLTCHTKGPTACDTCHGTPPTTGAHAEHVLDEGFACSECHVVPATWDAPGHILDADRKPIPPPATVTFGALANRDVSPPRRTAPASWDHASGTCSNVYCHGAVLGDPAASNTHPVWSGGPAQATCGTCHGKPPANHAQSECATCHPTGGAQHIDGVIDVGNGSGTCSSCHGDAQSPAPPRGLHGEQLTTDLAVGAHRAHLNGGFFSQPIACSECHVVPAEIGSPGHIDSQPPAELTFGSIARADSASPAWDRTTGTCTNVYCHGGGAKLSTDTASTRTFSQSWTGTGAQNAYCGSCHGLPPIDGTHSSTLTIFDCATCHPQTVTAFGGILVSNGKHINGVADFQ